VTIFIEGTSDPNMMSSRHSSLTIHSFEVMSTGLANPVKDEHALKLVIGEDYAVHGQCFPIG
jgi:hypothetical protein